MTAANDWTAHETKAEPYKPDGMAFVLEPHTAEAARRVLDAAVAAGHPESVVKTADDGYYVPADVVDQLYPSVP